jgi:hypothetical protein
MINYQAIFQHQPDRFRAHSHVVQRWSRDLERVVYGNHQAIVQLELSEAFQRRCSAPLFGEA